MSTVDSISSMLETYGVNTVDSAESNDMDKDAFLNLLVTQMQYQDPLEPTSNEDFLAQMAQFSSLEQMQNLNTSFSMQQGYELVGKTVVGKAVNEVSSETTYVEGVVEAVTLKSGETYLTVDGVDILIGNVEAVINDSTSSEELTAAIEEINESLSNINEKLEALTTEVSTAYGTSITDDTEE